MARPGSSHRSSGHSTLLIPNVPGLQPAPGPTHVPPTCPTAVLAIPTRADGFGLARSTSGRSQASAWWRAASTLGPAIDKWRVYGPPSRLLVIITIDQ